ncbi:H-NS family nucleoid-associated regulatory protein [Aeromonas salmonicida]|uniref:H-NS histone family protein n=1 Tax=Aeromonas salmonicida TaxID=645 RepID=UPI000C1C215B|nr:H-NS family nucleoid-associated regulatory protein [Aeromonas salmonicida]ATU98493.1 hypothetical protein CHQ57_14390 [Aeromonas salmonicida]
MQSESNAYNVRPYAIYDYDIEWVNAAKKMRTYVSGAFIKEELDENKEREEHAENCNASISQNSSNDVIEGNIPVLSYDYESFEKIYCLLVFISSLREYNFYVKPSVGRKFNKHNRLENQENQENQENPYILLKIRNPLPTYSDKEKNTIKQKIISDLFYLTQSLMLEDDFINNFDVHPSVPYFIKTIKSMSLEKSLNIEDISDLKELYTIEHIASSINKINHRFNGNDYKKAVIKRLANVQANLSSVRKYAANMIENSTHAIRICLGFNFPLDINYDLEFDEKIKKSNFSASKSRDNRLNALISGREVVFRGGDTNPVMMYVNGYIWKMDYCTVRGHFMHVILFLKSDFKKQDEIISSIGELWRTRVCNGDVFILNSMHNSIDLTKKDRQKKITKDIDDLFIQDILANVNTKLSSGEKLRSFGKGGKKRNLAQKKSSFTAVQRTNFRLTDVLAKEGFDDSEKINSSVVVIERSKSKQVPRPPMYRFIKNGEEYTWNGRGRMPTFLVQQIEKGHKLEEFLI